MKNKVRGLRNNNPANIRRGSNWKGLVYFLVDPSNNQCFYDKSFCQFESLEFGVRALIVVLRTYVYKYKLTTIGKILHRFAPLSENNTYAYIANVISYINSCYSSEFDKLTPFLKSQHHSFCANEDEVFSFFSNPKTPTFICRCLCKAICKQECAYDLSDEMLDKAISLL